MTGLTETHRSFVNTWECDENAHMNVQFYFRRFDEAARIFSVSRGGSIDMLLPSTRHVRFHAELPAAATTRIRSGVIEDGPFAGHVVHLLENVEKGVLSATALDAPQGLSGPKVAAREVERALPRGLEAAPSSPLSGDDILEGGGLIANRSIAQPAECDAGGHMLEQFHVARFTDAAPHVWEQGGVGISWLRAMNYGRVALEMKITHHEAARAGDGLLLYSKPTGFSGKTFVLRHELKRLADGAPIVTGEVVAVVMNLATRKTVPLPDTAGARVSA